MSDDLAPIATEVIYENDEVRIWNQVIRPGETLAKHRHDNDYVLVTLSGQGPLLVEFHDGTGGALGEHITLKPRRGEAIFVEKGHVETAVNEGDEYRAILVELKRGQKETS